MSSSEFKPISQKQLKRWEFFMHLGRKCGCHQRSERSFVYKNFQYPLCARCTGIVLGEFILAPIVLLFGFNNLFLNIACLTLMGVDGLLQYFNVLMSTNTRRLITGLLGGYAMMSLLVLIVQWIIRFF